MSLFLDFIFGFSTSFLGMVVPSMLNLTSVKINLERGRANAIRFAFGVGTIVLLQAYAAAFLIQHSKENPEILNFIQTMATFIFVMLSIYFFYAYRNDKKRVEEFKEGYRNTFLIGLLLSGLNMFAVPFYYGIITLLNSFGLLPLDSDHIFLFVTGSAIGSFLILYTYPLLFKKVAQGQMRSGKKLNLILGSITAILSLISLFRLF